MAFSLHFRSIYLTLVFGKFTTVIAISTNLTQTSNKPYKLSSNPQDILCGKGVYPRLKIANINSKKI